MTKKKKEKSNCLIRVFMCLLFYMKQRFIEFIICILMSHCPLRLLLSTLWLCVSICIYKIQLVTNILMTFSWVRSSPSKEVPPPLNEMPPSRRQELIFSFLLHNIIINNQQYMDDPRKKYPTPTLENQLKNDDRST